MDHQNPTPTPGRGRGRVLGGAAVGAAAIIGSLLALSGGAGAQDAPELTEPTAAATSVVEAVAADDMSGLVELDEEQLAELDAEWAAYDSCLSEQLGIDLDSTDESAWESITDDQFEAADGACESELPEDAFIDFGDDAIMIDEGEWEDFDFEALDEAWAAYDDCLAANGIDIDDELAMVEEADIDGTVFVEGIDGFSIAEFGEGDGTVTITKVNDAIEVAVDGDVTVLDDASFEVMDEEFEKAAEACEGELPEDVFFDDLMIEGEIAAFAVEDDAVMAEAEAG